MTTPAKNLKDRMLAALKQGLTPHEIALAVAMGVVAGSFPFPLVPTLLCLLLPIILKLNVPLSQLVSYAVLIIWIPLTVLYIRIGEYLLGAPPLVHPVAAIRQMAGSAALLEASLLKWLGQGALGWMVSGPVLFILIYATIRGSFKLWQCMSQRADGRRRINP
jgi:uncharacterized protein (DUF2062 family)